MPAEVLFDLKMDRPLNAVILPARSFRMPLAAVLATLSAVALALVGSPVAPIPTAILPVAVAAPSVVAADAEAPAGQPVKLHRGDEREIEIGRASCRERV